MDSNVLDLMSDGNVFVNPPCMVGVPTEKIVEGGPYWVASWISFEETEVQMKQELDDYEKEVAKGGGAKRPMQPINALAGLKNYFDRQGFHPNQLLSKQYITGSGLVHVGLLYKLKTIIEVLKEASSISVIKVQPLSWLRGRLAFIVDRERSRDTLKAILENFEKDTELNSVQNVCDMILRSPGHVRSQPLATVKKEKDEASIANQSQKSESDVKEKAKKDDYRRLHRKSYVQAHVNRHLKSRYQAYQEYQKNLREAYEEKTDAEESEEDYKGMVITSSRVRSKWKD